MEDLPIGYRFFPTEEELVSFYLQNKLQGTYKQQDIDRVIPVVHIYNYNPWDLPKLAGEVCRRDPEQWFFFSPMQEIKTRGGKPNRLTSEGYWKATGSPGYVYSSDNRIIGGKKTMVFYKGRACNGTKTKWKLNEYRAVHIGPTSSSLITQLPKLADELTLCRVYYTSKLMRAFDRRPNGAGATITTQPAIQVASGSSSMATQPAIYVTGGSSAIATEPTIQVVSRSSAIATIHVAGGSSTIATEPTIQVVSGSSAIAIVAAGSSTSRSQNNSISQRRNIQLGQGFWSSSNEESQSMGTGNWNLEDVSRLLLGDQDLNN